MHTLRNYTHPASVPFKTRPKRRDKYTCQTQKRLERTVGDKRRIAILVKVELIENKNIGLRQQRFE
jgi:hypothetical protein